jgi:hypothetical protein
MSSKKKTPTTSGTNLQALKIGSRVRCTDDGVAGRIVWANGTSVKIQWEDGEQVTWRRDALAGKPIELLDTAAANNESPQTETPVEVSVSEQDVAAERPQTDQEVMHVMVEQVPATEASAESLPQAQEQVQTVTEGSISEAAFPTPQRTEDAPTDSERTSTAPANPKRQRKASVQPKEKKLSALDAAAKVLAEEGRAMTCKEMLEVMAAKNYWTSPKGATPQGTLYSAILRELTTKGSAARFQKVERGKFARNAGA